jgi:hypothetical protein
MIQKKNRSPSASVISHGTKAGKPAAAIIVYESVEPPVVTNPFDARQELERGSVAAVGPYLRDDVASLLRSLASNRGQTGQAVTELPGHDGEREFEFETANILWAIETGHADLVASSGRELEKVMTLLGDMLDPSGASEFQLKPVRRRKGRPSNQSRASPEDNVYRDLKFARLRLGGKLEAAISEVGEKYRLSRSTLLRIWTKKELPFIRTKSPT